MPKLLQINTVVNTRATGRIVEEIGQLAIRQGWQSVIAYGRYDRPSKSSLIRIGTGMDVLLHGIETRLLDRHGLGSKRATEELVEKIKDIKPDIIHLHNLHGYYLNIEVLFNFLSVVEIPLVWTLHDCWMLTGHCTNFESVGCEKWKSQCYSCPAKRNYPGSLLIDRSRENYSLKKKLFTSVGKIVTVAVSQWSKSLVQYSFLAGYPTQVIHNGIDVNVFKSGRRNELRTELELDNFFVILGVASNWKLRKGLEDFLELSKKLPEDCKIVLVGLNNKELENLPSNISGFKRTENVENLVDLYSAADLFVNPTWEDNFPTTNIEALACGTPVLTYHTGGSTEAINSETGFIVEQGNIDGILDVVNIVKDKGKLFYSKACRERAVKYFNKNDRYLEYIDLYNKLINAT